MVLKLSLFFVLIFPAYSWSYSTGCTPENGGTCYQATCSGSGNTDIAAAIAAASPGDTVRVDSGSCTISTGITINKSLYLIGAGIDTTTIQNTATAAMIMLSSSDFIRVSGFTFTGSCVSNSTGLININSGNNRVDNIKFDDLTSTATMWIVAGSTANNVVIDNCEFADGRGGIYVWNNARWDTDSDFAPGTSKGVYVEDCIFSSTGQNSEIIDTVQTGSELGAVFVARYNTVNVQGIIAMHGADSGQRSGVYVEIYNNTFNGGSSASYTTANFRGGVQMIFGNTIDQTKFNGAWRILNYRTCYPADGVVYYGGVNDNRCDANTTNPLDGNENPPANGYPCKDQIGRGPNQIKYGSYQWNNFYKNASAANFGVASMTISGSPCANPSMDDHIQQNRDFFDLSTATGTPQTVGVRSGVYADLPAGCTTGVAYWATDRGSWNKSGSGGQGVLYKCTSTNNWEVYYTPYTYPHPLRGESTPELTIPAGVHIGGGIEIK